MQVRRACTLSLRVPLSLRALSLVVQRLKALSVALNLEVCRLTGSQSRPLPAPSSPPGGLPTGCSQTSALPAEPLTHLWPRPYTLPVPALWDVGLRRVVPLPLPPRNPPRKPRPRRNLPDTPKVSVLSFLSSAHVVRLELIQTRGLRLTAGVPTPNSQGRPGLTPQPRTRHHRGSRHIAKQPVPHWTGLLLQNPLA